MGMLLIVMRHDNLSFIEVGPSYAKGRHVPASPQDQIGQKGEKGCTNFAKRLQNGLKSNCMTWKTGTFFDYVMQDAASEKKLPMRSVWDMPCLTIKPLRKHLGKLGYVDLNNAGSRLLKASTRGIRAIRFRDRVMFPVTDARDRLLCLGAECCPNTMRPPSLLLDFTRPNISIRPIHRFSIKEQPFMQV